MRDKGNYLARWQPLVQGQMSPLEEAENVHEAAELGGALRQRSWLAFMAHAGVMGRRQF